MRTTTWRNILAMILALALLVSTIPTPVYAMAGEALAGWLDANDTVVLQPNATPDSVLGTAHIVAEDESRRGETYKEYVMNNGIRMATVYPSAIHYEENGVWKDIDNTLVASVSNGKAVYQNAAGAWNVRFPQTLSGSDMVGVTKDGHTVQFGMAGEMRASGGVAVASVGAIGQTEAANTLAISSAQTATAQIQQIDLTAARAAAEHPETVLEKLNSRLSYANVYPNTNVVYDLQGNQLKESVVLQQHEADLWGYRYTLDTGDLVPVLREDQQIDLCDPETNEVVLTMPAPYMLDDNGETNYDVEVVLTQNGSKYLLSYYLPRAWLAEADRAWPVILDPVITLSGSHSVVDDITVAENYNEDAGRAVIQCGYSNNAGAMRLYMKFLQLPTLTSGDVIVDATFRLKKPNNSGTTAHVSIYKVIEEWSQSDISWANQPDIDPNVEDYVVCKLADDYTWNITDMVRDWYENENYGMMLKVPDEIEDGNVENWKQFYSSEYGYTESMIPFLSITYQNHNGLEDYWSYSSASAGRAGTGYVNLFTGNLTWVRGDLGFDGNRMPVSISHVYNSNDSQRNDFGMGFGWRSNYHQTITASGGIYVWEDGDGTRHTFYQAKDSAGIAIANTYVDEDGLHLTLITGGSGNQTYTLTDQMGNKSYFDAAGRLCKIENNQQTKSNISITYITTTSKLISTITDGVGRVYQFHYQSNLLSKISYKGSGNTELTYVLYTYENEELVSVEDKKPYADSEAFITTFEYDENHLLTKATDVTGYNIVFTYFVGHTNRVDFVREYNDTVLGNFMSFEYSTHYTKTRDHKQYETYYQFNDWGNVVAVHDSDGHTQYTRYALNDVNDLISDTAEPNQIVEVFDIGGASNNLAPNSSFEGDFMHLNYSNSFPPPTLSNDYSYQGNQSLKISVGTNNSEQDVYDTGRLIEPGETYTYSTYILSDENGAEVTVSLGPSGEASKASSTIYDATNQWVRVQASYTNNGTEAEFITPRISITSGTAYIDCVQFEKAAAASDYSAMENGDAQTYIWDITTYFDGWKTMDGQAAYDYYAETTAANSSLGAGALRIDGEPEEIKYITQSITGPGDSGDVFVLSGWAKANAAPLGEYREPDWEANRNTEAREFGLKLVFDHGDGVFTEYCVSFDPDVPDDLWQYAAATFVAPAAYEKVSVQVVYSHQVNVAYFDGIQLHRNRCSSSFSYDENKNLVSETNILGQTTEYEYHANGIDLGSVTPSVGAAVSYEYDAYHNVTAMVESYTVPDVTPQAAYTTTYQYAYNEYGNVTSIAVTMVESVGDHSETLKQKSWTVYTEDGNYIVFSTNTYNETTYYGYDSETGVLLWVQYPGDTVETRTEYEYDAMYRVIGTNATVDQNTEMSVSYTYHKDLLETITTGSDTTYAITYGDYNLCKSVRAGNHVLATYHYSHENPNASENDRRNHNLEQLVYGNGDSVEYTYDYLGRVTSATYHEDGSASISRVIHYVYDSAGALAYTEDSATGIVTKCYYENGGRVATVEETDNATFAHAYRYFYDDNGNIVATQEYIRFQDIELVNNRAQTFVNNHTAQQQYLYDHKNRLSSVMESNVKKDYVYDGFNRVTEEIVSNVAGDTITPIFSNKYTYEEITVIENGVVSDYTGSRISKVEIDSAGLQRVYEYTYDENGNITSISDGTHTTTYVYDAANQLIRENNPGAGTTYVWIYDNAGNILRREEHNYSTAATLGEPKHTYYYEYDETWGDLLIYYGNHEKTANDPEFTYDGNGNLTYDGTWTYTWEQGRQLASMSNGGNARVFEYDANGMRTKQQVGNSICNYVYNGSQLTAVMDAFDKLFFTYDAAGRPLTLEFHYTLYCQMHNGGSCCDECGTYYYVTNLQGDVIALLDSSGNKVAEYAYDAWGNHVKETGGLISRVNPLRYRGYVYDRDTELYYLQSRYYNPKIGRFISADSIISGVGGAVLGNNAYTYCFNNPINLQDADGNWPQWIKNTVKWVAKNVVRPAVKTVQNVLAKVDLTYSTGINIGGTPNGRIINAQIGISMDTKGNFAIQVSEDEGVSTGLMGGAITGFKSITNAPSIKKLNGQFKQAGGSIAALVEGVPVAAGADIMYAPDAENNTGYWGFTGNLGFGSPGVEAHGQWGETWTVPGTEWNVFDVARAVYIKIMEW